MSPVAEDAGSPDLFLKRYVDLAAEYLKEME